MKLLKTLKDLKELYGEERMDWELERVCLERGVPHIEESCRYCQIDNNGWVYCQLSRHPIDHPRHWCPIMQDCPCGDSD